MSVFTRFDIFEGKIGLSKISAKTPLEVLLHGVYCILVKIIMRKLTIKKPYGLKDYTPLHDILSMAYLAKDSRLAPLSS